MMMMMMIKITSAYVIFSSVQQNTVSTFSVLSTTLGAGDTQVGKMGTALALMEPSAQ